MAKIKNIALFLFLAVFAASLFFNVRHYVGGKAEPYRDTVRTTIVDTIPYYAPVPKQEKPLGNITAKLPVSVSKLPETPQKTSDFVSNTQDSLGNLTMPNHLTLAQSSKLVGTRSIDDFGKSVPEDHFEEPGEKATPDSADVVIPITQTVYEDSTYTAYVSGYRANLDSLIFRIPREVTTITNTHYQKPKQCSVGIQVGYGMTLKGTPQFTPYIGVGVSYNLFSF